MRETHTLLDQAQNQFFHFQLDTALGTFSTIFRVDTMLFVHSIIAHLGLLSAWSDNV